MKKVIVGVLIVLFGTFAVVTSNAVSKDATTPTLPKEIELIKDEFRLPVEIREVDKLGSEKIHFENGKNIAKYEKLASKEDIRIELALEGKLNQTSSLKNNEYYPFKIQEIRRRGIIAYLVLTSYPKIQTDPEILAPRILIAVAKKTKNTWDLYLEGVDKEYYQGILDLPEEIMKDSSKKYFVDHINPAKGGFSQQAVQTTYSIPGLPWTPGHYWRYNQDTHGSNNCCVDFGTPSDPANPTPGKGGSATVRAADNGEKVHTSGTCVFYKKNQHTLEYQHIKSTDIANAPDEVSLNDVIGDTTISNGCGGSSGGHHLHFGIWDTTASYGLSIKGSTFNGWVINENTIDKGTASISPGSTTGIYYDGYFNPCEPPKAGTWTVYNNCYIGGYIDIRRINLIIRADKTLTLANDSEVNFNFKDKSIIIKNGGRLIVKPGGKLY